MDIESISALNAEDVARIMCDVLASRPRDRAAIFGRCRTALQALLATTEAAAGHSTRSERERFLRQSDVYLRALSTYSVTSDAWLNVFTAYRRMFDMHVFGRPRNDLLRPQAHSPYRPNPELMRYVRR